MLASDLVIAGSTLWLLPGLALMLLDEDTSLSPQAALVMTMACVGIASGLIMAGLWFAATVNALLAIGWAVVLIRGLRRRKRDAVHQA